MLQLTVPTFQQKIYSQQHVKFKDNNSNSVLFKRKFQNFL